MNPSYRSLSEARLSEATDQEVQRIARPNLSQKGDPLKFGFNTLQRNDWAQIEFGMPFARPHEPGLSNARQE